MSDVWQVMKRAARTHQDTARSHQPAARTRRYAARQGFDAAQCGRNAALARFMERYDADAFDALLDAVPDQAYGVTVMTDAYREYHCRVMRYRYERIFVSAWESR